MLTIICILWAIFHKNENNLRNFKLMLVSVNTIISHKIFNSLVMNSLTTRISRNLTLALGKDFYVY